MSRPRLIMNKKNLEGVETETDRDSSKGVETNTESLATQCVNTLKNQHRVMQNQSVLLVQSHFHCISLNLAYLTFPLSKECTSCMDKIIKGENEPGVPSISMFSPTCECLGESENFNNLQ